MVRRTLLSLCLLSGPLAFAGESVDFAQKLAERGYFDLAQEVCDQIKATGSAEDKTAIPFVSAGIKREMAEKEGDPEKARPLIDSAVSELEAWLKVNGGHKLANDARVTMGAIKIRLAQILNAALQTEQSPEKKAALQAEIGKLYGDVENAYRMRIRELQSKIEGDATEDDQNAYMDSRLELPRTLLDHARYGGVEDEAKKKLLTEAIGMLDEFNFDYGDRPMAYEGYRIQGECNFELGNNEKAEELLLGAIELLQRLVDAGIEPSEYHWGIIRGGYISLAKMYMKVSRTRDAAARIDEYLAKDKNLKGSDPYYYMKLLKGDALFQGNERDKAIAVAKAIMSEAGEDTAWGQRAKDRIAGWFNAPAAMGVKISAADLMTTIDSYMERGKYFEALQAARACIEACGTPEEREKLLVNAWYKKGQCLQEQKRNYEAAVAYETVVDLESSNPKSSLGPKACFKALSCYAQEFDAWGNPADEKRKDEFMNRLLSTWKDAKEGKNLGIIKADKLRNAKDLEGAAKAYLDVSPEAEAYEFALVQAGICYFFDAAKKWGSSQKSASDKSAAASEMTKAEECLKKFLARLTDPAVEPPEEENDRELRNRLKFGAQEQLARLYSHETVGKAQECLDLVDEIAKEIPAGDDRLGKLWQLKVGAYLALDKLDDAVTVLEEMFSSYPDGAPIATASKSVAIRLDELTNKMTKEGGDEKQILANLKKVSKYYMKWLSEGPSVGLPITLRDVVGVAQILYMVAKRANGLDEKVSSFLDLKDRKITERSYWDDAAFVHEMLVSERAGKLPEKDRLDMVIRLARCHSFVADTPQAWERAKNAYNEIVKSYKLVDAQSNLDYEVLKAKPALLGVYLELGAVYLELGRSGQKFQYDNAITAYNNVLKVTQAGSEPWWIAKYMALNALCLRGGSTDAQNARIGVDNLQRNYPDYDEDKWGMKAKFKDLERRLPK